jgi:outer membrane immunogenic protein
MRTTLTMLCAGALAFSVTAANAADLPIKAPEIVPPPLPVYNWTGFYIGVNAGYGWGEIDDAVTPLPQPGFGFPPFSVGSEPDGFIGGIQLGYNWQTGNFVWGIETDFQGSTLDETTTLALGPPAPAGTNQRVTTELDWFGTVRGRLGVTFMPELLAYVTGGFAYGDVTVSSRLTAPAISYVGSGGSTETGWTVGGGLEYGWGNWSAKVEYLYVSLSAPSHVALPRPANPPFRIRHSVGDLDLNIVRVGLNYRF